MLMPRRGYPPRLTYAIRYYRFSFPNRSAPTEHNTSFFIFSTKLFPLSGDALPICSRHYNHPNIACVYLTLRIRRQVLPLCRKTEPKTLMPRRGYPPRLTYAIRYYRFSFPNRSAPTEHNTSFFIFSTKLFPLSGDALPICSRHYNHPNIACVYLTLRIRHQVLSLFFPE